MNEDHFDNDKLRKGVEYSLLKDVLKDLEAVDEAMDQVEDKKKPKSILLTRQFRVAAVLIPLIIISGLWLFKVLNTPDPHTVPFFEPFENDFVVKTRSVETLEDLERKAFRAYDDGDYVRAEGLFKDLLDSHYKNKSLLKLFLANCQLGLGKTEGASIILEELLTDTNAFRHEVQWYLAISLLDLGDSTRTRSLLLQVASENDSFSEKATTLLDLF